MADNAAASTSGEPGQDQGTAPENLIDAAKAPDPKQVAPAGDPAANAEWFWSDGVKGTAKAPDWYDSKKYKSVAEQAKAYPELSRKYGEVSAKLKGFAGAPEKYELSVPEDLAGKLEWLPDDPLLGQFQTIAKESGMSQDVFAKLLHTFAQYEYTNMAPDWAKEKTAIGERADERLSGFWDWTGANLDDETAMTVKRALGVNPSPAEIFKALEAVQNAGRQPAIHKADDTVSAPMTVAAIDSKYRVVDQNTKRALIDTPEGLKAYRAELAKIVGSGDHKVIVGQKKAS